MVPIEKNQNNRIFLATTALEEFWDTSMPMVFLGEWCQRYSRKFYWESLSWQLMETPWPERETIIQAADYINALYERLLSALSDTMNSFHGVNHSVRYWRILLGPWLLLYLPVVYDRYNCLQKALKSYPELTTKVLAEESWITPADTLEFVQLIKDDPYNLQIYSRLLKLLGNEYPSQSMKIMFTPFDNCSKKSKIAAFVAPTVLAFINNIAGVYQNKVVFTKKSYFSKAVSTRLLLKSSFKVIPLFGKSLQLQKSLFDISFRNNIGGSSWVTNEFELLLSKMISMDIPQSFVEGFNTTRHLAAESYPVRAQAIFSANSWYFDEIFKQWAAASSEKGTQLLGIQHGGNYGSSLLHPSEDHEVAITNRYYSWGWTKNNAEAGTVVPMPSSKLIGSNLIDTGNRNTGILYVATTNPRYLFQFPYIPIFFKEYLEWQARFMKQISEQLIPEMRIRLHREDLGWDIGDRWDTCCPEIAREDWGTSFTTSMQKCRLYVSDNLQTTFLEGLAVNKPGVLFWNSQHYLLRPEALPYYNQLRAVGILHDSPEEAAQVVNEIYTDVESWWNEPHRQLARRNFCERFAQMAPDAVEKWTAEFKQVLRGNATLVHDSIQLNV